MQAQVTALSTDWGVSVPGLLTLPNGSLEAFFGAAQAGHERYQRLGHHVV